MRVIGHWMGDEGRAAGVEMDQGVFMEFVFVANDREVSEAVRSGQPPRHGVKTGSTC